VNPPGQIETVWYGYAASLHIGDAIDLIQEGLPTTVSGVTLSVHPVFLRPHVLLIVFKLQNTNDFQTVAHVAVQPIFFSMAMTRHRSAVSLINAGSLFIPRTLR
jgi:hypothetical protein